MNVGGYEKYIEVSDWQIIIYGLVTRLKIRFISLYFYVINLSDLNSAFEWKLKSITN